MLTRNKKTVTTALSVVLIILTVIAEGSYLPATHSQITDAIAKATEANANVQELKEHVQHLELDGMQDITEIKTKLTQLNESLDRQGDDISEIRRMLFNLQGRL